MDQIGILERSILFIKARRGKPHDRLLEYIKNQKSLKKVIQIACLSTEENGKRHRHQNRISKSNLLEFHDNVRKQIRKIRNVKNFDELIRIIRDQRIAGIGELTIYDVAHRIGLFLNILPDKIYLHCGTRKGAKLILGKISSKSILKSDLPEPLKYSDLECWELEDLFCLRKNVFKYYNNLTVE
jgi:hypothetical protein